MTAPGRLFAGSAARFAYAVGHREVTAGDTVEAQLAPGGGHCLMIRPASEYVQKTR